MDPQSINRPAYTVPTGVAKGDTQGHSKRRVCLSTNRPRSVTQSHGTNCFSLNNQKVTQMHH